MVRQDSDYNKCDSCGVVIKKTSKKCRRCAGNAGKFAKNLPPDAQIVKEVEETNIPKVANKYGVGLSTIQKILLKYKK